MASTMTMFELRPDGPLIGFGCDCGGCGSGECDYGGCGSGECDCGRSECCGSTGGESEPTTADPENEVQSCPGRSAGVAVGVALVALAAIAVVLVARRWRAGESAVAIETPE